MKIHCTHPLHGHGHGMTDTKWTAFVRARYKITIFHLGFCACGCVWHGEYHGNYGAGTYICMTSIDTFMRMFDVLKQWRNGESIGIMARPVIRLSHIHMWLRVTWNWWALDISYGYFPFPSLRPLPGHYLCASINPFRINSFSFARTHTHQQFPTVWVRPYGLPVILSFRIIVIGWLGCRT